MKKEKLIQQNEGKNKALRSLLGIIVILSVLAIAMATYTGKNEGVINEKNIRGRHLANVVREFNNTRQFCNNYKLKTGEDLNPAWIEYQMDENNYKNFDKSYVYRICKEFW